MAPVNRYYQLSVNGGNERLRWSVEPPGGGYKVDLRLADCTWIDDWTEITLACRPTKVFEDMPWSFGSDFFVSPRLREFLEAEAPGHAQYLPVRMEGPGVDEAHRRYWAVNWLHLIDCIDLPRSMDEGVHGPWMPAVVIDPARIPSDVLVGRLKGRLVTTIIRGDLMKKIKKAGFTGPQFYDIWMSTDPGAPEPIWKPGVRRETHTMPWPERRHRE